MAYTTIRQLASSLHESLKQTFDDADITLPMVVFWVQFFINKYQAAKVSPRYQRRMNTSGMYLSIYSDLEVTSATTNTNPNVVSGRKYITLPTSIHDLESDGGIAYVSYGDFEDSCQPSFAGVRFTRTSPTAAMYLYKNPYEKPSPSNPYFYRINNNYVYLLGIENVSVQSLEAGLYTTFDPFSMSSLDNDINLDEALVADVYRNVFDLGRFVMLIPSDPRNEGTDTSNEAEVPRQRMVSVNEEDPVQQQFNQQQ